MMHLVCATTNADKAAEIADMLREVAVLLPRPNSVGHVDENAPDLRGNAILKASAVSKVALAPAVADDTGLEVDALQGAPGVFSARYAGPNASYADNVMKLLRDLADVPTGERSARFRTVAAVCWPDGQEVIAEGSVEGFITTEPRGSKGFGYDAIFVPVESDSDSVADDGASGVRVRQTFAELSAADKNRISHRGRAFRALARLLIDFHAARNGS